MKKIFISVCLIFLFSFQLHALQFDWSAGEWIIVFCQNNPIVQNIQKFPSNQETNLDYYIMRIVENVNYKHRNAWKIAIYKYGTFDEIIGYMFISSDDFEMLGHSYIDNRKRGWSVSEVINGFNSSLNYSYPLWNSKTLEAEYYKKPKIIQGKGKKFYVHRLDHQNSGNDEHCRRMYFEWDKEYSWFKVIEEVEPSLKSKKRLIETWPILNMTVSRSDIPKEITTETINELKKKYRKFFEQYEKH